jgi:hypothetical protein
MSIDTIKFKSRPAGSSGLALIKLLAVPVLALGCCTLLIAGCGKTAAPKVNGEVTVAEMNQAIRMMSMSPLGAPKTVDELTNFPALKGRPFPVPAAGKKFAIDPVKHEISIVNQ